MENRQVTFEYGDFASHGTLTVDLDEFISDRTLGEYKKFCKNFLSKAYDTSVVQTIGTMLIEKLSEEKDILAWMKESVCHAKRTVATQESIVKRTERFLKEVQEL